MVCKVAHSGEKWGIVVNAAEWPGALSSGLMELGRIVFANHFHHAMDAKNRIAIPAKYRDVLRDAGHPLEFYLRPPDMADASLAADHLELMPRFVFEAFSVAERPQTFSLSEAEAKIRRRRFSLAVQVEADAQGRIVIPERFMAANKDQEKIGPAILRKDLILVGMGDRIELWNEGDYEKSLV